MTLIISRIIIDGEKASELSENKSSIESKLLAVASSYSMLLGSSLIDTIFINQNDNSEVNNRNNSDSPIMNNFYISFLY